MIEIAPVERRPNGAAPIAHGSSVTAYQASSVPCGNSCVSQVRTCNNGILSGSFTSSTCSVQGCAAPCALPWGGTIPDGASVTAYASSSVACGATCSSQVRTCSNGSLSGSFGNMTCAPACPSFVSYGCLGADWVPGCTSQCYACKTQPPETGFFAYNDSGCSGTCFNRFVGAGTYNGNPLVVMFTRSNASTAHARFFFTNPAGNAVSLTGQYRIYAKVPVHPAGAPNPADGACPWRLSTATTYTLMNNAMPAQPLQSVTIDQAASAGARVLLFQGNLTGAYYVTVTNHWPGQSACGQVLLDHLEAVPF